MKKGFQGFAILALGVPALGYTDKVHALDWGLQARAGYIYTDNVAQAPDALSDATGIGALELAGSVEHATRDLFIDFEGNHSYRHFFDNQYDAESRSQVRGEVEWSPLADLLKLSLVDVYGQSSLEPAEGLLPTQYENANVLAFGPTLSVPIARDTRLKIGGEYRDSHFQKSDVGTVRKIGTLGFEHDLTRLITAVVEASHAKIDFDRAGTTRGYDLNSADAGLIAVGRRTLLAINAGYDSLRENGRTVGGTRYQLDVERQISRDQRIYLSARREVTDAADVFTASVMAEPSLGYIRDVQLTAQPMTRGQYRLAYAWAPSRFDLQLQGRYIDENFRRVTEDPSIPAGRSRQVWGFSASAGYRFAARSNVGIDITRIDQSLQGGERAADLIISGSYMQSLTNRLALEFQVQAIQRDRSPRDFDEKRLFAYVRYDIRERPILRRVSFDRSFERRAEEMRRSRPPATFTDPSSGAGNPGVPGR